MRILTISNLYPPVAVGGYEKCCAHTMRWLAHEHEVIVLTSGRQRRGLPAEPDVYRALPWVPESRLGVLLAPLASWRAVRSVRRALRKHRPDLVFVWNASDIPRACVRAAQATGVPVAFSVADPWLGSFEQGDLFLRHLADGGVGRKRGWSLLVRAIDRLPGLRIDLRTPYPASLVWNSRALRDSTRVPVGVSPVLERVIHPASENERLFASIERAPAQLPTIAFVGRLESEKAPDVAVRALALLRDRHGIDARLVMAGEVEPTMRSELERLTRQLALEGCVELRGKLPVEQVAAVLAEAHAIVVPSRWQEPFGLVCLEAALARVPVVAARSGGMPEMLEPDEQALFFTIDDVDACAAALARTLADPAVADARARRAHERVEEYSLGRYREAYDTFVKEALAAARKCAGARRGEAVNG
ncbi:MAG TPA: glycosyltransferase [Solirubrobacteraceae bacterium]|nr:glycosyltransferase [Solirubrobacteraceae bacterium]